MKIIKLSSPMPHQEKEIDGEYIDNFDYFELDTISDQINKKVHDYFVNKYPHSKAIGSGGFGIVYDIGENKVAKITTDRAEIGFLKRNINKPYMPQIYNVKFFGKVAIIEMEKVKLLSKHQEDIVLTAEDDLKRIKELGWGKFKRIYIGEHYDPENPDKRNIEDFKWMRNKLDKYEIIQMRRSKEYSKALEFVQTIKKDKLDNDAHLRNIGLRENGDFVLLDIRNPI